MMGPRQVAWGALFSEFSIEGFVPLDHPQKKFTTLFQALNGLPHGRLYCVPAPLKAL